MTIYLALDHGRRLYLGVPIYKNKGNYLKMINLALLEIFRAFQKQNMKLENIQVQVPQKKNYKSNS